MNFYKRHLGDYSKKTPHLKMLEHGAYALLLDYYYSTEHPLPGDMTDLYRFTRAVTKTEQLAVRNVAEQFFRVSKDGLRHNKRADEEIAKWGHQRDINKEIAKKAGRPPKIALEIESNIYSISAETDSICHDESNRISTRNPSQKPESRNHKKLLLPDFLNVDDWTAFKEHRKKLRAPLTEEAEKRAITKLKRLHEQEGQDTSEVINESIVNGYKGLFPLRQAKPPPEAWWTTHEGIERKGKEVGLTPNGTESYEQYKARIFERLRSDNHLA